MENDVAPGKASVIALGDFCLSPWREAQEVSQSSENTSCACPGITGQAWLS